MTSLVQRAILRCFTAAALLPFSCTVDHLADPIDADPLYPSDIVISEVQTANSTSLVDQFGETPDWIELYNKGDTAVDLAGYSLSDDRDEPDKWICGPMRLAPGSHAVVCASGRDVTVCSPETADTIDLSKTLITTWADSQNNPRGNSHIRPVLFPGKVFGDSAGSRIISAHLYLDDNARILTWQTAEITIDLRATKNYTAYDYLRVIGTIQKGKHLEVRICQLSVENWLTYGQTIIGTGRENDVYDIRLSHEPRLNRAAVTGIILAAGRVNDSITMTITGLHLVTNASYQHASFKLSSDGDALFLSNPRGKLVDRQSLLATGETMSQGRPAGNSTAWVVFDRPTPGRRNDSSGFSGVSTPLTISAAGGFFNGPLLLKLVDGTGTIYYTTDGSEPTIASSRYSAPISIDSTTLLRYRAIGSNLAPGEVNTGTYFIGQPSDLPVLSIAVEPGALFDPDTGIYMKGPLASDTQPYFGANFWLDKEIPVHIEFYEPDGTPAFSDGAGLKIFGNYSRQNPKKSLAVYFKDRYGKGTLTYRLFPDAPALNHFESFILRNNGGNFQRAMFEDALAGALSKGLGVDFQKYRPAVVYINGRYWGIHNIREKLNTAYIEGNHGYAPDQIDFIKGYGDLEAGDKIHYEEMLHYLKSFDIRSPEHYAHIAAQMDIDNYINYTTCEIYYGNTDWPANNNGWWRPRTATGKWRWIIYDVDGGFGSWGQRYDTNTLRQATDSLGPEWPNPPWSTFILRTLLKNPDFKRRFINRAGSLLGANFETSVVLGTIDRLANGIRSEIPRDFARWDKPVSYWDNSVDGLREWARKRPDGIRKIYSDFFSLQGFAALTFSVTGPGTVDIDGFVPAAFPFSGIYFTGNPLLLTARPKSGSFKRWSDGSTDSTRTIDVTADSLITAIFE